MISASESDPRPAEPLRRRQLSRRQWMLCAVPVLLGLGVGVAAPSLQFTGSPVCQMVQRLSAISLQDQPAGTQPSSSLLAQIVPDIDFDLLAREAPARLRGDVELGRRRKDRLIVLVDPAEGRLTPADAPLVAAVARIATWLQEECG